MNDSEDLTLGSIRRTTSRSDDLGGHDGNGTNGAGSNGGPPTWSYEEQFKQVDNFFFYFYILINIIFAFV